MDLVQFFGGFAEGCIHWNPSLGNREKRKEEKGKRKGQLIAIATFVLSDFGNNTQIMKLGIVISSNDAETVWNAFRLGNLSLTKGDEVKCFLLAKGVETEGLSSEKFDVQAQMEKFVETGGQILACGTCLKIRNSEGTELCPLSTMEDLYRLIDESDKLLSV